MMKHLVCLFVVLALAPPLHADAQSSFAEQFRLTDAHSFAVVTIIYEKDTAFYWLDPANANAEAYQASAFGRQLNGARSAAHILETLDA